MTEGELLDDRLRALLEDAVRAVPGTTSDSSSAVRARSRRAHTRRRITAGALALAAVTGLMVGVLANGGSSFAIVSSTSVVPANGQPTPKLHLTTLNGTIVTIPSATGQWLVLGFVSSPGCPPCQGLERGLAQFAHTTTGALQLSIVLVNEGPSDLPEPQAGSKPIRPPWRIVDDFHHLNADRFGVTALPMVVLINPAGHEAERIVGGGAANAIDDVVAPSLLRTLTNATVGKCSVTIALTSIPIHANDPMDVGEFGYSVDCPGHPHGGIQLGTLTPPWQTVYGEGGSGTNPGYFSELFATTDVVTMVKLVDPTGGQVLSSMAPVWDGQFGRGFAVLVVPSSEAHMGLVVEALDGSGSVVATENWTGYP